MKSSPKPTADSTSTATEPDPTAGAHEADVKGAAEVTKPAKPKAAKAARETTKAAKPAAKTAAPRVLIDPDDPFAGIDELSAEEFLEAQKVLLASERATYLGQAEMLRAEADQLAADMEPGEVQFDDESGEGATVNVEREFDLAMSAQAAAAVEEIDRALHRVTLGTYGVCEGCGKPIPRARLRALPYATMCISCKNGGLSRR